MNSGKSRGNALFLILIAVALFAALAYAVTQSSKDGGNASREQESLALGQILQYGAMLEQALTRLVLINGCTVGTGFGGSFNGTLAFDSSRWANPGHYDNPLAPANGSCHVFSSSGGGVDWQAPPAAARAVGSSEYDITGGARVFGVGTDTEPEALLYLYVTRRMCLELNTRIGVPNPGGNPPTGGWTLAIPLLSHQAIGNGYLFSGNLGGDGTLLELHGYGTGCYYNAGSGKYIMYSVLIAR